MATVRSLTGRRLGPTARGILLAVLLLTSPAIARGQERGIIVPKSGQLVLQYADLVLSAQPAPLVLERSYRGPAVRQGPFGPGWSIPFDLVLQPVDKDLVVVRGKGELRTYTRDPRTGLFWGSPGQFVQIDAKGSAERRDVTGWRERFDVGGRVVERAGPNRNVEPIRFRYGVSGRLDQLVAANGKALTFTYDAQGRVAQVVGPAGLTAMYRYDDQGRLAQVANQDGVVARYGYNAQDRLISIQGPDGSWIAFEYDAEGRVLKRTSHDGRWERYTYDQSTTTTRVDYPDGYAVTFQYTRGGVVETTRDSLGQQEVKEFDIQGALLRSVDAAGIATTYTYDQLGRPVKSQASNGLSLAQEYLGGTDWVTRRIVAGQEWRYEYDADGNVAVAVGPDGGRSVFGYFPNGLVRSVTGPLGNTVSYEYNADNNLIRDVNPLGGTTQRTYDARGRLTTVIDAVGGTTHFDYGAGGRLSRVVDPLGGQTRYEYDARGFLTARIDPMGRRSRYEYDPVGRLVSIVPPDGVAETYKYDVMGRIAGVSDGLGRSAVFMFDPLDRIQGFKSSTGPAVASSYDAKGSWSRTTASGIRATYTYDPQQRLATVVDPVGATVQYSFDLWGRLVSSANPVGGGIRLTYGPLGELTAVSEAGGQGAQYGYDQAGHLVRVVHPNGGETRLAYDPMGNVISTTDPSGQTSRATYDQIGRQTSATDANGHTIRFGYDAGHRLVIKQLSDRTIRYSYDAGGELLRVDDGVNPLAREYDAFGRLIKVEYPSLGKAVRYAYDSRGLRTKLVVPDGREISYEYDSAARLVAVVAPDGRLIRFSYDADGRLSGVEYPNHTRARYAYDAANRPVSIIHQDQAGQVLVGWQYVYDAAGNRTEVRDHTGRTTRYRYDATGQLTEEDGPDGISRYAYLPGGDRERYEVNGQVLSYRYDLAHRLLETGPLRFAYDGNGNVIRRETPGGTTSYTYDAEGRLIEVMRPDRTAVRFGYAANGARLWREEGGARTWFVYDGINLLGELDTSGRLQTLYLHGPGVDMPLAVNRGNDWYALHADVLGSISAATNDGGRLVGQTRYGAFGEIKAMSGTMPVPFGFTGRESEGSIDLYYYRARYYDPAIGRFLSPDSAPPSLTDVRSLNPYLYADNNPARFTDPLGLAGEEDRITQWLIDGGFWNRGGKPVIFDKDLEVYAEEQFGQVTFGPLAAASRADALSTAFHEWLHVMQNLRLEPLVQSTATNIQQCMQRALAVARIQEQGGMLAGAPGPLVTTAQELAPHTPGRAIMRLYKQGALAEEGGKLVATPLSPNARSALIKGLQQEGSLVAGNETWMGMGRLAAEREAYAAEAAYAARQGFVSQGLKAAIGYVTEGGGSTVVALGMAARALLKPVLQAAGIAGVINDIVKNYRGFQAARELRTLEWQQYKNSLLLNDLQDTIVENALKKWLSQHPELIKPGMKLEDALAQMMYNLHDARRRLFDGVVPTATELETERDRLRKQVADTEKDLKEKEDRYSLRQTQLEDTLRAIRTLQEHERERTKILSDLGRLPLSEQQKRQSDIKRNTSELLEIRAALKENQNNQKRLEEDILSLKSQVGSLQYEESRLKEQLQQVETTIAKTQGALTR